jgi:hypothetical protein
MLIPVEEKGLRDVCGERYDAYLQKVRKLVPLVYIVSCGIVAGSATGSAGRSDRPGKQRQSGGGPCSSASL